MDNLNFIDNLISDLEAVRGLDEYIVDDLIDDIRALRDPKGDYSLWNLPKGKKGYWGTREWYAQHPLQPVLDYWHCGGYVKWLEGRSLDPLDEETLLNSLKGEEHYHDKWYIKNLGCTVLECHPDMTSIWNALGAVFRKYVQYTAGEAWFKKNWDRPTYSWEEYQKVLKTNRGFDGENYTRDWDKTQRVEFDLKNTYTYSGLQAPEWKLDFDAFEAYVKSYQWCEPLGGFICEVWTYREDTAAGNGVYSLHGVSVEFVGKHCRHSVQGEIE